MNVPDALVYASLPITAGAVVWIARQFVREQSRRDDLDKRQREQDACANPFVNLSARDAQIIVRYIEQIMNGRYLQAKEARVRFRRLHRENKALCEKVQEITVMLARYAGECRQKESEE